jgi:uncharacterized membrane protein
MKNFLKNLSFPDYFIGLLIMINVLPVLAPLLMEAGLTLPAKAIYFVYSFMCHQMHWRSIHVYDHQCAWCARDMAIWGAVLVTVVLIRIYKLDGLKWYQIIPFAIPIGLDGGIQTIATVANIGGTDPVYISNNLLRTITGSIFGIGLGGVLMNFINEISTEKINPWAANMKQNLNLNFIKIAIISFLTVFISYLGLVQFWDLTSSKFEPSNFLDYEVRLPDDDTLVIERRRNAVCPVTIDARTNNENGSPSSNLLDIDCFFGNEDTN